ncbi:MAG: hypothetical protein ABEN55_22345, partial [Bradymonadaceae bacterium]
GRVVPSWKQMIGWGAMGAGSLLAIAQGVGLGIAAYREAWPETWVVSEVAVFGMWGGLAVLSILFGLGFPVMMYRMQRREKDFDAIARGEGDEEVERSEDDGSAGRRVRVGRFGPARLRRTTATRYGSRRGFCGGKSFDQSSGRRGYFEVDVNRSEE